jgi:hypothetical protein
MTREEGDRRRVATPSLKLGLVLGLLLLPPLAGDVSMATPQRNAAGTADLTVALSGPGLPVTVGEKFDENVLVNNFGPDAADGLSITITFSRTPASVGFDSPVDDRPAHIACAWSLTTVTCHATASAPPLGDDASVSNFPVHIVMSTPGTLTLTATVSSAQLDPNPSDNTISASRRVVPRAACRVPNLLGKTLRRARHALASADCRVGRVGHKFSSVHKRGRVIAQRPHAGVRLKAHAQVNVVLGTGPRP